MRVSIHECFFISIDDAIGVYLFQVFPQLSHVIFNISLYLLNLWSKVNILLYFMEKIAI